MTRESMPFGLSIAFVLTGCVGSIVPIADSSAADNALLGKWSGCQGTKIEVTIADASRPSKGYAMRVIDRKTHRATTYRLFIQRIGDEEFGDVFYAPRDVKVNDFRAVHGLALIRHDKNDILFGPLNDDWWKAEHLKETGLQVVDMGDYTKLILGTPSALRTFLAAHAHDPEPFLTADQDHSNYGRLKRKWTRLEAEGCSEDL